MTSHSHEVPVERLVVSNYTVPTDLPESDGTLEWNKTTLVLVQVTAGGNTGLGYTYADSATAKLIHDTLKALIVGADAMAPASAYMTMWRHIRNLGRPGICSLAISAVDCALWDLKAKLLDLPMVTLLGQVRGGAPIYGSGGFISYSDAQLASTTVRLGRRKASACVKMKIGRDARKDVQRVKVARDAIGPAAGLYIDANGAYTRKQALSQAKIFCNYGVELVRGAGFLR